MSYSSTDAPWFADALQSWFLTQREILLLIRYSHAAGSKDFELFTTLQATANRIHGLPPRTCVTAFKQPQLPIRGIVDDDFIAMCLARIPDGVEYLLVELTQRDYGRESWFHHGSGESHAELLEELEDSRGVAVALGPYPPWLADTDEVISAVVPDERGFVSCGVY